MRYAHQLKILNRRYKTVALFTLIGLLAAAIAVLSQPLRYGASVRLLIIQRSTLGLDPYTAVKSAERIADNLSQVVHTQDFITKVLRQDSSIDQSRLPTDPSKRRKAWHKTVRTSLVSCTGLLTVTALSEDKNEAVKIAQAIADVLSVSGKEYIGGDLEVKVVDTPLPSSYPISPNIPLAAAIGVVFGFAIGAFYVLWKEEGRESGSGAVN